MRLTQFLSVVLLVIGLAGCGTNSQTKLSDLTGNNTSAARNFSGQPNGNLGANNVSKMNVHSLLYSGTTTRVLAQFLLWFGGTDHMNVGYNSNDPAQVKRQIRDMISRGIDGVIVDWYGPNNSIDQATKLVMREAERHPGFTFSIMVDAGAIQRSGCAGCSPQDALIQLLQYVEKNYFGSRSYERVGGQPMVTSFNIDSWYSVDWNAAKAALSSAPSFLFQDNAGFSHAASNGSYSWIMPWAGDYGLGYLTSFYATGFAFANEKTVGAAYKGFNDALAAWGSGRYMDQQCGQTWLDTFAKANSLYSPARQLPYFQVVTWNDYEEGTEIESGIDNCFSLDTSISGNTLQWGVNGNENTIDHYNVYASRDGQTLSRVIAIKPGTYSVDLCSLPMDAEKYQLFVQAVGKPSIANRMPGPVSWTRACGK